MYTYLPVTFTVILRLVNSLKNKLNNNKLKYNVLKLGGRKNMGISLVKVSSSHYTTLYTSVSQSAIREPAVVFKSLLRGPIKYSTNVRTGASSASPLKSWAGVQYVCMAKQHEL